MSGLDPLGRVLVKELMKGLKEQWKTIFFNTHILSDVEEVADRFGIIFDGKIIYEDSTKNLEKPLEEFFKEIIQKQEGKIEIR
jgi:ABC-2 type transport system ATP-binding protein